MNRYLLGALLGILVVLNVFQAIKLIQLEYEVKHIYVPTYENDFREIHSKLSDIETSVNSINSNDEPIYPSYYYQQFNKTR